MNDHEKAAAEVRALELKHSIDEMRCVHLEDGRNTIHEIYMRNEFGEWGTLGVGLARRRKGDKRDQRLGGSLSLYRALVSMAERHREEFAKRWPEYFQKDSVSADTHAKVADDLKRARAIAVTLEQQNARALELLEGGQFREVTQEELMEGRYSINDHRRANRALEAIRVLRGDDA